MCMQKRRVDNSTGRLQALEARTARLGGFTLNMNVCTLSANRREVMARVCTHTGTHHDGAHIHAICCTRGRVSLYI